MKKIITYFGQKAKVACDEKCDRAFGISKRPRVYPELGERVFGLNGSSVNPLTYDDDSIITDIDEDKYEYLSDDELEDAPVDPGTYEGGDAKPQHESQIPNKWCVRECERCVMSRPNEWMKDLELRDFSKRFKNYY